MQSTNDQIRQFLGQHIKQAALSDEEDIFASGFVNSLFALQLVLFVERHFDLTVEDEDLDMENFKSIGALERFVHRKTST